MAKTSRGKFDAAFRMLKKHGQEHLLRFADQLDRDEQTVFLEQIKELDFELIDKLLQTCVRQVPEIHLPEKIVSAPVFPAIPKKDQVTFYQKALERGENLIAEHKVAAFTVAGGMGTRLNFDGPKGNVPATPVRNKTLFRVFAEYLVAIQRRFNCVVPWYIMTSPANHDQTVESFKQNNYFGLTPENVMLFSQGTMPCFGLDGKILLESPGSISVSPDGHGGSLRALHHSGALKDMARRGVEYISYFQVDNPLVYVIDPLFIGLHAVSDAEMSSKAVHKVEPLEKVGNFALVDGKVTVIESSDLPNELAHQKNKDGAYGFDWGSIAIHILSRSFIEKINLHGFSLPWHRALKRVPYVDDSGTLVNPDKPNAVKLETFVFDALPLANKSIILEIDRDEQFAPIKNASGVDSLPSSQSLQIARAARWMEYAGVEVPKKSDGSPDLMLEISPLFALDREELKQKSRQLRPLKPGDIVYLG